MTNKLFRKFANLKNGIRQDGWAYLLHAIRWRIPVWLFYYKHAILVSTGKPVFQTRNYTNYHLQIADVNDCELINALNIYTPEKIMRRLEEGDVCHFITKNGKIVSIIWAKLGKMFAIDSGPVIDTGDDAFFVDGLFTIPEERMKGLHTLSFKSLYDYFVSKGRNRIIGVIHSDNIASIKTHNRMKFDITGETYYIIIFGISICYYKKWPNKTKKIHIFTKRPPNGLRWV